MWNSDPDTRLREWKAFRDRIGDLSIDAACTETVHLWAYAPFVSRYLDPDNKIGVAWPDPWTLLYENYYCDLAKSLGMLYTLYLSRHKPNDIELAIYFDRKNNEQYNLVRLSSGKYILNYEFDTVVNKKQLPKTLELRYCYTATDLNMQVY